MRRLSSLLLYTDLNLNLAAIRCLPQKSFTRFSSSNSVIKRTCLFNFHMERNAKMEPFAGYMMPILYKNQTIKSEHLQTRQSASTFDVSHMMQTVVSGKNSVKFLESLTVADIESMELNRCVLSVFTNEAGGIIDDCIISKRKDHIHIVSNAGNADIVWSWLNSKLSNFEGVSLVRLEGQGLIALQGPKAAEVLQREVDCNLGDLGFMNTIDANIHEFGLCQITRCGYTGEDGFEISVNPTSAEKLMKLLCQDSSVKPAGLGSRDTLRLEAGLCLHGHDINDTTTPVEANLNWTVAKRRRAEANFPGAAVILNQLKGEVQRKRTGMVSVGTGPPAREGTKMTDENLQAVGTITSGTYAPSLEKNIAMGYLNSQIADKHGTPVYANIRGKTYEYRITKMPFVKSRYYIKSK